MSLFRSETMEYVRLVVNEESARETIRVLGEFELLHIEDHGSPDKHIYKENKRRILACNMWKKKLTDFRIVMERNGVRPPGPEVVADDDWQPAGDCLDQIKRYFEQLESDLTVQFNFKMQEMTELNTQLERKFVLLRCQDDLAHTRGIQDTGYERKSDNPLSEGLLDDLEDRTSNTINGTIPVSNQSLFERMVYRVAKGHRNAIISFQRIESNKEAFEDPTTGEPVEKSVFSILLVGKELPRRIRKICNLFGATIFEVPRTKEGIKQELVKINKKRVEGDDVLAETNKRIRGYLESLAKNKSGGSPLVLWERAILQEQLICEALQKFYVIEDSSNSDQKEGMSGQIAAYCWVPQESHSALKAALRKCKGPMTLCETISHHNRMPPTYFKTNKFTSPYQGIVDTYGIGCYKEANPGLFTIITFPYLFGVMYGDIFHGSMITLAALYMLWNEKRFIQQRKRGEMNEIFAMAFGGRYMVVMMGIFAVYCGTVYNDCASIPLNLYGSVYENVPKTDGTSYYKRIKAEPYPWGIDPNWFHKANSLTFINSFKMKYAVTIGVCQMTFGILLGLSNDCYHNDVLSMLFEFVPRFLFMMSTFGYMIFMIIFKFFVDWTGTKREAPNLIQTMIKMFLSPGSTPPIPLYDSKTQVQVQTALLIIAVLCIPMMLFPKACIKKQIWKNKYGHLHQQAHNSEHMGSDDHDDDHGHHDHRTVGRNWSMSDEMITTGIHTIEFILGAVSNTASYLRLWALSLAHAELSEVFWDKMIMQYGINSSISPIMSVVGFAVWGVATCSVLLCMDVLESFLHALRLHWVEFQNKFYTGEGYKFKPFKLREEE